MYSIVLANISVSSAFAEVFEVTGLPPWVSLIPRTRALSTMKHAMSSSLPSPHLWASWARQLCGLAKVSSRSKSSRAGGGGSLKAGGKTAGCRDGRGTSNLGGMRFSGPILVLNFLNRAVDSATASSLSQKTSGSKSCLKSLGSSSPMSCRQDLGLSDRLPMSGMCW